MVVVSAMEWHRVTLNTYHTHTHTNTKTHFEHTTSRHPAMQYQITSLSVWTDGTRALYTFNMQVFCLPNAHNKCNNFRVYRYFQVIIVHKIIIQQLNMNEMPILSYWLQSIYYYQHCEQISFFSLPFFEYLLQWNPIAIMLYRKNYTMFDVFGRCNM